MNDPTLFDIDKVLKDFEPFDKLIGEFYNTTGIKESELRVRKRKADAQTVKVYEYFKAHPDALLSPWDVLEGCFGYNVPITSVRRAISDLTKEGLLTKTHERKVGKYNELCYMWRLKK
jgi:hypothetical protein